MPFSVRARAGTHEPRRSAVSRAMAAAILALPLALTLADAGLNSAAWAQGAEAPPKQIKLTQATIDHLVAAQKQIRAAEGNAPQNESAPDPKLEGKIAGVVKASGFASMADYSAASYSVGMVLAGLDPDSGTFIGAKAALKKQIDEVTADKQMQPKEKKEALDELNAAMQSAGDDKPLPGNVDLVKANLSKLNEGMQPGD
jgi:hypothetical protein